MSNENTTATAVKKATVKKAQPSAKERGLRSVNVYLDDGIVDRFHRAARKNEDLSATAMTRKLMLDWLKSVE